MNKIKANTIYELWDRVEKRVTPELKEDIRYCERERLFIMDYEMADIANWLDGGELCHFNCNEFWAFDDLEKIVKHWWRGKPRALDCNQFFELCMEYKYPNIFELAKKELKEHYPVYHSQEEYFKEKGYEDYE